MSSTPVRPPAAAAAPQPAAPGVVGTPVVGRPLARPPAAAPTPTPAVVARPAPGGQQQPFQRLPPPLPYSQPSSQLTARPGNVPAGVQGQQGVVRPGQVVRPGVGGGVARPPVNQQGGGMAVRPGMTQGTYRPQLTPQQQQQFQQQQRALQLQQQQRQQQQLALQKRKAAAAVPEKEVAPGPFAGSLSRMMYGFGDAETPANDTVHVMEDLLGNFITDLCTLPPLPATHHTTKPRQVTFSHLHHTLSSHPSSLPLLHRLEELALLQKDIKEARKTMDPTFSTGMAVAASGARKDDGGGGGGSKRKATGGGSKKKKAKKEGGLGDSD